MIPSRRTGLSRLGPPAMHLRTVGNHAPCPYGSVVGLITQQAHLGQGMRPGHVTLHLHGDVRSRPALLHGPPLPVECRAMCKLPSISKISISRASSQNPEGAPCLLSVRLRMARPIAALCVCSLVRRSVGRQSPQVHHDGRGPQARLM